VTLRRLKAGINAVCMLPQEKKQAQEPPKSPYRESGVKAHGGVPLSAKLAGLVPFREKGGSNLLV